MADRTLKRIVVASLLLSVLLTLASCGGSKSKHTWGDYPFTAEYTAFKESYDKTRITITLDFGKNGIPKNTLDKFLKEDRINLADIDPSPTYLYSQTKDGNVKSVNLLFSMEPGYQFQESDLVIKDD